MIAIIGTLLTNRIIEGNFIYFKRDAHILRVLLVIPNQQFTSRRNVLESSVINVTTVLKGVHVLLGSIPCTSDVSHPTGLVLIASVNVIK